MNRLILKMSVIIMVAFGCQQPQEIIEKDIYVELAEKPIWVNSKCEGKTIMVRFENIDTDILEAELDNEKIEMSFMDSKTHGVQYGKIFLPKQDKNMTLKIVDRGNKEIVLSEDVMYLQTGDTIKYYSNSINLPRPIIVNEFKCWTNLEGVEIPRNNDYRIYYELERINRKEGVNLTRTLVLRNVSFEDTESKVRHTLSSDIRHSTTVRNLGKLENRKETLSSNDKLTINLGNQLNKNEYEFSSIIRGEGGPSYMVIENVYGNYLEGVVTSCNEIDTLKSESTILPEFIQIGMDCK